jgi:eukaryotic-like serine/threonine-protein kinase
MKPERWSEVKPILHGALGLKPEDRTQFLRTACAGDLELQREIEAYLDFEQPAAAAFPVTDWGADTPSDEDQAPAPDPGQIGSYRILRRLGEGGMGVVYLAEHGEGEYCQKVAVKVLKAGSHTPGLLKHFRAERRILARLQHPHIAHLTDGGTTESGQLYYVMEYVEGLPLTSWCAQRSLTVRQRLEVFQQVCMAVSHAHRNLIIHRDLKPANILVTADGAPKLLDFGLAKVFEEVPEAAQLAASTALMLTPGYASPEQVRGEHLTTATDVYSLGVLLYELLAGQSPYLLHEPSPLETCRAVCEQDPKPPSRVRRNSELAGDLDNIVLMALRKEPERRYGSVEELRQDIERYLSGFPVRASRGTFRYRLGKFVRRHRLGVAASLVAGVLAILAVTVIWWQGRQSEMRFNEVRQLAHSVVFELHDAIQNLPGSTAARKLLVERALQYLKDLESTGGKKRELEVELAAAYRRIGDVQGDNLNDTAGALESYTSARRLLREVVRWVPDDTTSLESLAEVNEHLGTMYMRHNDARSFELWREGAELWRKLEERRPGVRRYAARALFLEALIRHERKGWKAAMPGWEQTVSAYAEAASQEPRDPNVMRGLARSHSLLAFCYQQQNDLPAALNHYRESARIDSLRVAAAPEDSAAKMQLSYDLSDLGWVSYRMGKAKEAVASQERGLALQEQVAAADPQDFRTRMEIAKLLLSAAPAYESAGDRRRAIKSVQQAVEIFGQGMARDPNNADTRWRYAWASSDLGSLYAHLAAQKDQSPAQACAAQENAAAWYERSLDSYKRLKNPSYNEDIARITRSLAECRQRLAARR